MPSSYLVLLFAATLDVAIRYQCSLRFSEDKFLFDVAMQPNQQFVANGYEIVAIKMANSDATRTHYVELRCILSVT